jgi:hypothetical protein
MPIDLLPDSKWMADRTDRAEKYARPRTREASPETSLAVKIVIATVLVGFAILHIIAGAMIQQASTGHPVDATLLMHKGD